MSAWRICSSMPTHGKNIGCEMTTVVMSDEEFLEDRHIVVGAAELEMAAHQPGRQESAFLVEADRPGIRGEHLEHQLAQVEDVAHIGFDQRQGFRRAPSALAGL